MLSITFWSCQGLQCRSVGFLKGECSEKKQKTILCKICDMSYHKRCRQILRRNFDLVSRTNANCYCQFCFVKNVPPSDFNKCLANVIITSDSNKSDFYSICNSVEVPFDDDEHHIPIHSKYFNINEFNSLKTKEKYFGILRCSICAITFTYEK